MRFFGVSYSEADRSILYTLDRARIERTGDDREFKVSKQPAKR